MRTYALLCVSFVVLCGCAQLDPSTQGKLEGESAAESGFVSIFDVPAREGLAVKYRNESTFGGALTFELLLSGRIEQKGFQPES